MTGAISGAGTAYPSGAAEFNLGFSAVYVTRSLFFYVVFCILLFVRLSSFFFHYIVCPPIYDL